jgi:Fur family transcriptional regulator, ferric uptake regulator
MPETGSPARRSTRQRAAVNATLGELAEFRTAQQLHDELRRQGNSVGLLRHLRQLLKLHVEDLRL